MLSREPSVGITDTNQILNDVRMWASMRASHPVQIHAMCFLMGDGENFATRQNVGILL